MSRIDYLAFTTLIAACAVGTALALTSCTTPPPKREPKEPAPTVIGPLQRGQVLRRFPQ